MELVMQDKYGRNVTVIVDDEHKQYSVDGISLRLPITTSDAHAIEVINGMAPENWQPPQPSIEEMRTKMSCSPFQGRMALAEAGLLSEVETAISQADEKTKTAWEYALVWQRTSEMISSLAASLNMTEEQVDTLFISAQSIQA
jgi:hypothetical protein